MKSYINFFSHLAISLSILTMFGCAQVSREATPDQVTANVSGLELQDEHLPTLVYIRPGASTLANYNKFIIDPIVIDYTDPGINELSQDTVREMQQYFQRVMTESLTQGGYEVVTRSAQDTLRMTFRITDLKAPQSASNVSILLIPGMSTTVGEVTVEATFRNSATNRIDAVVLENSRGSYMFNPNPLTTMSDVEAAFDQWAEGFRASLDKAHGK